MRRLGIAALAALVWGCAEPRDVSRVINVAPSAAPQMEAILDARDKLNAMLGEDAYIVREVNSEAVRDDEVVVRGVAHLVEALGRTTWSSHGIVVQLPPGTTTHTIAHEFLHCAGLEHVADERNLMFDTDTPNWGFEAWQRDEALSF
jgi:hypothetical protein